jgi:hypothetical protein
LRELQNAQIKLDIPNDNPEVISAFYTETLNLLSLMNKAYDTKGQSSQGYYDAGLSNDLFHNSVPFFVSGYYQFPGDYQTRR